MLNVIFYLKATKVNLNGESPIYARITHKHQSTTMATGKSMPKERWLFTNNLRNPLKAEKEKVIKKALEMFRLNLEKKFLELQKIDPDISLNFLKNEFSGVAKTKRSSITIGDIMEHHNVYFARKVEHGERAPASLQKYERAAELIKAFIKQQYNADDIAADEITSGFVYNLESYLKYDSNYRGKAGIRNNSVVKYMKIYKTACTYCIRMDLLDKNPFNVYDGKLSIMDAVFLTQQELNLIEKKRFVGRLEKVKDIFLFSCYTGYAPVDAAKLTAENLFEDNGGELWIMTSRAKTAIRANVPLLPPALAIIDKYKGQQAGLIPTLTNQKMNSYLKEVADICGIAKNLTWYVARHTFATTVTLGNGIRIEHVSAMLGHTNIRQTQHYAKVLDHNVMNDMAKLKNKYGSVASVY
jgi:site-specific recombinase XerD